MGRELIELPLKNTKAPGTRGTRGLDGLGFRDHRLCFCLTIRIVDQFRCSRAVAISGYFSAGDKRVFNSSQAEEGWRHIAKFSGPMIRTPQLILF
jgi:hypothetical protein